MLGERNRERRRSAERPAQARRAYFSKPESHVKATKPVAVAAAPTDGCSKGGNKARNYPHQLCPSLLPTTLTLTNAK